MDTKLFLAWLNATASALTALAGAIGVPFLIWYSCETSKVRKLTQQQVRAATAPLLFFDDARPARKEHWEECFIINGSAVPAVRVQYRLGTGAWHRLSNVTAGERMKLPCGVADLINEGLKSGTDEGLIALEYFSASGVRFETRAVLKSEGLDFYLEQAQ